MIQADIINSTIDVEIKLYMFLASCCCKLCFYIYLIKTSPIKFNYYCEYKTESQSGK